MRDFAWASVKLFAPAAGAPGLFALGFAIAGVLGWGFAAGAFCATASWPSAVAAANTAMAAVVRSRFISQFLDCRLVTQIMQTSLAALRSASAETFNPPGTDQEKREFSDPVLSTLVPSSMTARRDAAELGDSIASP